SKCYRQVRFDLPLVLGIHLVSVRGKSASDRRPVRKRAPALGEIILSVHLRDQTQHCAQRIVITVSEARIYSRVRRAGTRAGAGRTCWIEVTCNPGIRKSSCVIPGRVVRSRRKRVEVIGLWIAQEVEVSAKLQRVPSFDPGNVIHEILNRDLILVIVCDYSAVVKAAEENHILRLVPKLAEALPRVPVPEVIHESRPQHRGVAHGIPFAVVHLRGLGWSAGQIGYPIVGVISQRATPEESLIPIARDLVISASDIPVGVDRHRALEAIADEVEAISHRVIISGKWGKRLEIGNHNRLADPYVLRIHALDLPGGQPEIARCDSMRRRKALHSSPRALRWILANVLEHAVLHCGARHNTNHALGFALTMAFVIDEE